MKTEKELAIEKAEPICMDKGLSKGHFKLIILLFEGKDTKEIADIWGHQYDDAMIRDEVGKIYRQLEKSRTEDEPKINSHTRIFRAVGLIPS